MAKSRNRTPDAELAAAELLNACGQLVRRLRAESNSLGLTWSQAVVLSRLEAGPMSTADLARAEAVKPQSMGATLAVLEDERLVERSAHPTDGRQFLFGLTEQGVEARRRVHATKQSWLAAAVGQLSAQEQADLVVAAGVIHRLADMSNRDAS